MKAKKIQKIKDWIAMSHGWGNWQSVRESLEPEFLIDLYEEVLEKIIEEDEK